MSWNRTEVLAARTIAEKGVQLVGTDMERQENLIKNPSLADLIGPFQYKNMMMKKRGGNLKRVSLKEKFTLRLKS
jgi:stage III sporulation protein SpoIIIAA